MNVTKEQRQIRVDLLSPEMRQFRMSLGQRARETAILDDTIPEYIHIPWMNKPESLDQTALIESATLLHEVFSPSDPQVILGIGNSGLPLAQSVSMLFPYAQYAQVDKLGEMADLTKYGSVVSAFSYRKNYLLHFGIPYIDRLARVLVIDDFVARGNMGKMITSHLIIQHANVVGFGANADKAFQGGLNQISALGVDTFSVIRIQNIDYKQNQIALMPEMYEV